MLPTYDHLHESIRLVILDKERQGHVTSGLMEELALLPKSYDALSELAERLASLPMRSDWPYVEPDDLPAIETEWDPPEGPHLVEDVDLDDASSRAETAFLASVVGCVLGKPLEVNPTLAEIRTACQSTGEWPLSDYVSAQALDALGRRHRSWTETTRGNIAYVAPDDDINYTILGMLILEERGLTFDVSDIRDAWLHHLPIASTFGPERTLLVKAGLNHLPGGAPGAVETWATTLNPYDEKCGALIRADAYGYACPGNPALAAELAWRDASWTHRRTGIYGAMFVAAAIATAFVVDDPLLVFRTALGYVPQRSRFYEIVADELDLVATSSDWLEGYERIHCRYEAYSHCLVYQECGTLINTLKYAESIGDGLCKQVSQGNDTDSFGATAGSLLGAFFGPEGLDSRWLAPFQDDIHTGLAHFFERSLSVLAKRMGQLPHLTVQVSPDD